jgi:hypothetical protein
MIFGGILVLGSTLLINVWEERKRARAESTAVSPASGS